MHVGKVKKTFACSHPILHPHHGQLLSAAMSASAQQLLRASHQTVLHEGVMRITLGSWQQAIITPTILPRSWAQVDH